MAAAAAHLYTGNACVTTAAAVDGVVCCPRDISMHTVINRREEARGHVLLVPLHDAAAISDGQAALFTNYRGRRCGIWT